jgi:hypothetical protein
VVGGKWGRLVARHTKVLLQADCLKMVATTIMITMTPVSMNAV